MYGEARRNIDILHQIVWRKKYYTISLLHVLIIQKLCYQPINIYTIKTNPQDLTIHYQCTLKF